MIPGLTKELTWCMLAWANEDAELEAVYCRAGVREKVKDALAWSLERDEW